MFKETKKLLLASIVGRIMCWGVFLDKCYHERKEWGDDQ